VRGVSASSNAETPRRTPDEGAPHEGHARARPGHPGARCRRTDTVTAIARVAGSGFTLDATATQSHKVDSWGEADPDRSHLPRCQGGLIDQVVPGVWDTARREGACRQTGLAVETGESGAALYRLSLAARQPFGNHRKSVDR